MYYKCLMYGRSHLCLQWNQISSSPQQCQQFNLNIFINLTPMFLVFKQDLQLLVTEFILFHDYKSISRTQIFQWNFVNKVLSRITESHIFKVFFSTCGKKWSFFHTQNSRITLSAYINKFRLATEEKSGMKKIDVARNTSITFQRNMKKTEEEQEKITKTRYVNWRYT